MTPQEQLEHEAHMAKLLALRGAKGSSSLAVWLNSTVLAAFIGVVGTGILGAVVSGRIQENARRNELELAEQREARAARAAIVERLLAMVSRNIAATDDLLVTVNNVYKTDRFTSVEAGKVEVWKEGLAKRRDESDSEWREARRSLGYSLEYRFGGDERVRAAWREIVEASDSFEACTNAWYTANARTGSDLAAAAVCSEERHAYEAAVELLAVAVR